MLSSVLLPFDMVMFCSAIEPLSGFSALISGFDSDLHKFTKT